jgi:hypothetical protein
LTKSKENYPELSNNQDKDEPQEDIPDKEGRPTHNEDISKLFLNDSEAKEKTIEFPQNNPVLWTAGFVIQDKQSKCLIEETPEASPKESLEPLKDESVIPLNDSHVDDDKEIFRKSVPPTQTNFLKKQPTNTYKVVRSKHNPEQNHSMSMINNKSEISKVARKDLYNKGIV